MESFPDKDILKQIPLIIPVNLLENDVEKVDLGGITCDSGDILENLFLPKINDGEILHLILMNIGAYQSNLSGYGGLSHCQLPESAKITVFSDSRIKKYKLKNEKDKKIKLLGW